MLDRIESADGVLYDLDDYYEQFYKDCEGIDLLWKLERRQTFREPGVPSWDAFAGGDIDESMRLAKEMQPGIEQATKAKTFRTKRVRIVEEPLTPYLWWEFQLLKMRTEAGDEMVINPASTISDLESKSSLPEIVGLGGSVLWHVIYDEAGTGTHARRITDAELIRSCRSAFEALYEQGEPLLNFYSRVVAPMSAPTVA